MTETRIEPPRGGDRFKVTYDLLPELAQLILSIASDLHCSQSDVAAHLLAAGLAQYRTGGLDLKSIRRPHTCQLRFTYKLTPPKIVITPSAEVHR